jgi:hypothetical protein
MLQVPVGTAFRQHDKPAHAVMLLAPQVLLLDTGTARPASLLLQVPVGTAFRQHDKPAHAVMLLAPQVLLLGTGIVRNASLRPARYGREHNANASRRGLPELCIQPGNGVFN